MYNLPDFLSSRSASRNAPVTSPSYIGKWWLEIVCNTVNLPLEDIVGA